MAKAVLVFAVLAAGTLGLIVVQGLGSQSVACEVCIEFRGRVACREALGPDQASAQRTATDNACAFLASGMTDSIACSNTKPSKLVCE